MASPPVETVERQRFAPAPRIKDLSVRPEELSGAIDRDHTIVLRHMYVTQRGARLLAAVILGALAILLGPASLPMRLVVVAVVASFGALVWLASSVVGDHGTPVATQMATLRALGVADLATIAIVGLCAGAVLLPALPIPLLLVVALVAQSRGSADGWFALAAATPLFICVAAAIPVVHPDDVVSWTSVALISFVTALGGAALVRTLGPFRTRLDSLRRYCKFGELGESDVAIPIDRSHIPDELTILAGSFDAMRLRLSDQVGSDPLTHCANRRTFEGRLLADWRLARRRNSTVAIAAVDVDHFKQINDTRGHPVGDLVLQGLASIMLETARESDTVARLGGDEFVVVLPDTDHAGAVRFAERLRSRVMTHPFGNHGDPLRITVSV
jgi:diguanylate cyclase (GGDEF)-like protein